MIGHQRAGKRDRKLLPIFIGGKYWNLDIAEACDGDCDVCPEVDVSIVLAEKVTVKQCGRVL
jgi:hypothetical protein